MDDSSSRLDPLEFTVWRRLEKYRGERWLIAVSGGRDSVVAATLLGQLKSRLELTMSLVYVHHGVGASTEIRAYRDHAQERVSALAKSLGLDFYACGFVNEFASGPSGSSEEALREFRLHELRTIRGRLGYDRVVLAHHRDDLLETRLLRLIRGTGADGLQAMCVESDTWLRPFLEIERASLAAYAEKKGLKWLDDPSNLETTPLRNWLRLTWLEELEQKRPGATRALERSLDLIVEELEASSESRSQQIKCCIVEDAIDRRYFNMLSYLEKKRAIVFYLRRPETRGISSRQIGEIVKRLDTDQKNHTFIVGKLRWLVNAGQIRAEAMVKSDLRPK